MSDLVGPAITLLLAIVGGLVWLLRLEGRVNTEQALRLALSERLGSFESRILSSLQRIEDKLDDKADRP